MGKSFDKDGEIVEMARLFLSSNYHITSHVTMESLLGGMETKMYHYKMNRLANSICLAQRLSRNFLEMSVVSALPKESLLSYVDMACFDETAMVATIREAKKSSGSLTGHVDDATLALLHFLRKKTPKEAVTAKILQVRPKYGMLLKLLGTHVHLHGTPFAPLQVLEANTGEVALEALQRQAQVSFDIEQFQHTSRVVCCDQAGANTRAEK
eukprot:6477794-Amphidinium_carterae.1